MYQDTLNLLSSNDYYLVKKNIDKLINDSNFIKEIIKVHNPVIFDRFIKMCEFKIDVSKIQEERNKFIRNSLLDMTKDNIYDFFELNNIDKSRQETIANRYLIEYIIYYYTGDNYYNFMTNLYQMVNYLESGKNNLVSIENINLYKELVNLRHMSFIDKIGFFKLLLDDMNIMEMFYDDLNIVREDSHKSLTDNVIKLNHENGIYDAFTSKQIGVDVYKLDGEEFYGFVRCLSIPRGNLFNYYDHVNSEGRRLGYSFSYIGDKNIGTIDFDGKGVTLFYDDIDYKSIMYVHHGDLHSKRMDIQDDYLSQKENEIVTPKSLIAHTKSYNEIYIKNLGKGIKPKALVCYDQIDDKDIAFAKKHNVSLLVINRKKYQRYEYFDEDYDSYSYVL